MALPSNPRTFETTDLARRIKWYVSIRWIFMLSVGLSGVIPEYFNLGTSPEFLQNVVILLAGLAYNGVFWLLARVPKATHRYLRILGTIQVASDTALVSYLIFTHGGIESRSIVLYAIPIMLAGATLGRRATYLAAVFAALIYDSILLLDYYKIVETINNEFPSWHQNAPYLVTSILFYSAALIIIGMITDFLIRLLRQEQQRLKDQTEILISAQRIASIGSWEWYPFENRVVWSNELYRIFGVDPNHFNVTFGSFIGCVSPSDRPEVEQKIKAALVNKSSFEFEHRIVRPDGETRYLIARGSVAVNEAGQVEKMYGTAQDITERKQTELIAQQRTAELEKLNRLMVGRELKMAELKRQLQEKESTNED